MQKKKTVACLVAVLSAVVLSVLRVVAMPRIVDGADGVWNIVLFVLSLVVVAFLLLFSDKRPPSVMMKNGATLLSVGAVFTGAAMVISSLSTYMGWRYAGVWPYPADKSPTQIAALFTGGALLFGLISGVFFLLLGVRGKRLTGPLAFLSFAPLVWAWMRVCQYEVSYYSSSTVFRHWYDLLLLLLEMVFFLWMTRYLLRVDKPPRLLLGMSLSVGAVAVMACVTRVAMVLLRDAEAFASCGLLTAADLGVALFAFGFAFAWHPAEEGEDEQDEEDPAPPVEQDEEVYLLSGLTLTKDEDEEADYADIHDPRKPLELEDVLMDILQSYNNEEK